jgi:hypothetical protein
MKFSQARPERAAGLLDRCLTLAVQFCYMGCLRESLLGLVVVFTFACNTPNAVVKQDQILQIWQPTHLRPVLGSVKGQELLMETAECLGAQSCWNT